MSDEIVEIDKTTINALASSTRRTILKTIKCRPMTVSELGRVLAINKSAVFKHLQILQSADLITKQSNDNEFVYYTLTMKGDCILENEGANNKKIFFVLSTFFCVFILGLLMIYSAINRAINPATITQYWDYSPVTIDIPLLLTGFLSLIFAVIFLIYEMKKKDSVFKKSN